MTERTSMIIMAAVGITNLGVLCTFVFYILKNMTTTRFCDERHTALSKEVAKDLRRIRKGIAFIFAKTFNKEHKIPELNKGDASMIVETLAGELNGDGDDKEK